MRERADCMYVCMYVLYVLFYDSLCVFFSVFTVQLLSVTWFLTLKYLSRGKHEHV